MSAPRDDGLAAAFARTPREIARPDPGREPLFTSNPAIRAVTDADRPEDREIPFSLASGEALRFLLIFAEAPESWPKASKSP